MKLLILLVLLPLSSFASTNQECVNTDNYRTSGWVVHKSTNFKKIHKALQKKIQLGLEQGTLVDDLQGVIRTSQTVNGSSIYMDVRTYDSLETPKEEMFGDIATLKNFFVPTQILELRWYENQKKHIVFNANYLNCVSTIVPMADNSVF